MTQVRLKVKKGDLVEVLTGRDTGRRGLVQKVLLNDSKLIVDGVNKYSRNVKQSAEHPDGGKVEKLLPIHVSNVGVVNPDTSKVEKIGIRLNAEGKRERFFKKTGNAVAKV